MFLAELTCAIPDCEVEVEVQFEDLDDLDRFGCECGGGLVLLRVSAVAVG